MTLKGIGWLAGRQVFHITGSTAPKKCHGFGIASVAKREIPDKLSQ
jgi:hypothetical protein